jgi:hypothetical protein
MRCVAHTLFVETQIVYRLTPLPSGSSLSIYYPAFSTLWPVCSPFVKRPTGLINVNRKFIQLVCQVKFLGCVGVDVDTCKKMPFFSRQIARYEVKFLVNF